MSLMNIFTMSFNFVLLSSIQGWSFFLQRFELLIKYRISNEIVPQINCDSKLYFFVKINEIFRIINIF